MYVELRYPHSVATTFTSSRWRRLDALPSPPLVLSRRRHAGVATLSSRRHSDGLKTDSRVTWLPSPLEGHARTVLRRRVHLPWQPTMVLRPHCPDCRHNASVGDVAPARPAHGCLRRVLVSTAEGEGGPGGAASPTIMVARTGYLVTPRPVPYHARSRAWTTSAFAEHVSSVKLSAHEPLEGEGLGASRRRHTLTTLSAHEHQ